MNFDYDLFVIGAGSGGVRAARMSASFGARVAIAEERYLGGTCVNVGCIPKKLFVYGSHFAEEFEDSSAYGWNLSGAEFDWDVLRNNKTKEIQRLNGIYQDLLESAGVEIFSARADFVDNHTVRVDSTNITAERILIATGSWPHVPDFPGSEHAITSNEMFYLDKLPERIAIVGGGYIAVEFAGIMNGLGVETSLVYRGPLFLRGFDGNIREFVKNELEQKGVRLLFEENLAQIESTPNEFHLSFESGHRLDVELVMYATGRRPLTTGLGLENTSVELEPSGAIRVDQAYRTTAPSIYALGDVIDRAQLTPVAIAEGMAFSHSIYRDEARSVDYSAIPTCVFCQPNIGTVGPTEEAALQQYRKITAYESSFRPLKHTVTGREERSYMKLLVDEDSDRVIAAHMVGPDAGEIIQGLAVAISAQATKSDFDRTIGIHPTLAEEFVTMRDPRKD